MSVAVDWRSSVAFVGTVLRYLAVPFSLPLFVALLYGESPAPFVALLVATVLLGRALERLAPDPDLGSREAFLFVGSVWLVVPLMGTVPYLVEAHGVPGVVAPPNPESTLGRPTNALSESMSGFTTTGATVVGELSFEAHTRSVLLWRQLTQWLGGMGIVVLMVAILPELSVGGARVVREESPGPSVEKLAPRIRDTARVLWAIYAALTLACVIVYYGLGAAGVAPRMGLYNAVAHALTTMPTGGFSPEARSIEAFAPAVQWAVTPFMLVAGTNFALFWYVLRGEPRRLVDDDEFRAYLAAIGVVTGLLAGLLFLGTFVDAAPPGVDPAYLAGTRSAIAGSVEPALRHGLFQALAIVTTTGYASVDFNVWSESAQLVLLVAMFLGGSAGSAAGSIKIVRWLLAGRAIRRELYTAVHPDAVRPIRLSGEPVDEDTVRGLTAFVVLFVALFAVSALALYLDAERAGPELSAIEAVSAAVATLGNVGPGVGAVGPMNSFRPFSVPAKLYMVFLMWIGRLEVLSVLVLLTPSFWRR